MIAFIRSFPALARCIHVFATVSLTVLLLGILLGQAVWAQSAQIDLRWPTPNPAWENGEPIGAFLQHAGSGNPTSGSYGSVRNNGTRFHEGIDLFPVRRDERGEPLDEVFAAMSGIVRHVNTEPKHSSYGCYVVLEHDEHSPAVYTLYAHLASVDSALLENGEVVRVCAGQVLGRMGRSAGGDQGVSVGGYVIPKERAHLHFEMGLRLTDDFEWWYDAHGFDDPNHHGVFNGMNLMGFDPLAFYEAHRAGRLRTMADWFAQMQPAVTLDVATCVTTRAASTATPDFVRRYPSLVKQGKVGLGAQAGWRIECDPSGIPFRWTPLSADDVGRLNLGEVRVVAVDEGLMRTQPAKQLVVRVKGEWVLGRDLESVRQLVFGYLGNE